MQFGYGVGGGATAIESTRRRWLALLLAFLLGTAMVLVTASPAGATDNSSHHTASLTVTYVPGECSADVTFTNLFPGGDHHFYDVVEWEIRLAGGGPTLLTIPITPVRVPAGTFFTDEVALPAGEYSAVVFTEYGVAHATDPVGESPSDGFETVTSASFDVTCEDFSGNAFAGEISNCQGSCAVVVNDDDVSAGEIADVEVITQDAFVLVLRTLEKGPSPGKAEVWKDVNENGVIDENGPDFQLPTCGKKGTEPVTDCVHINRVNGNHTEYTVFFTNDPRFRFR